MIKLENEIIIQKPTYRLIAYAKDSSLAVSLTVFAQSFNNYKYYQGLTHCNSVSGNKENEKRLVNCLLRYLQKQESYKVDIRNKKLVFPEISGLNGVKKSMDIQLKQKWRSQKQILQQQFKRRQFHHNIFQQRSFQYLTVLNKKLNFMKKVIEEQNKKIVDLETQQCQQQKGLPSKKVKLTKKSSEEQHKIQNVEQQKEQQIQLKSFINNRNKLYFQKINIQKQQKIASNQNNQDSNKSKRDPSLFNIIQLDSKEEVSEQQSLAESKWVVIKSDLDKFSLFANYVKYEGLNEWSRIIMNVPFKNKNKQNQSFIIQVQVSKEKYIMVGVVSQKNKSLKPSNYELKNLKGKGYFQYCCPSDQQYLVGGFQTKDEIKVTIKYEQKIVQWSVNGSTFASQMIGNINNEFYPCIQMYTKDDVIQWIF